jgi:hypothetical protein
MMYPAPNAAYTGVALTLFGTVLPTSSTNTADSPPINISMHTAYPHYCAWKSFLIINNAERAQSEFLMFDGLRKLNTRTATATTGSLQKLNMSGI